jgi:hypothetical protein
MLSPGRRRLVNKNWPGLLLALGQFESDRAAGFLLAHHGARDCMPVGSNVLNPQANEITAPELAVDRQIE